MIGSLVVLSIIFLFILFIDAAVGPNAIKAVIECNDRRRSLKRLKKKIDKSAKEITPFVKGVNDGVRCIYCGAVYEENTSKCSSCGGTIEKLYDPYKLSKSSELRQMINKRNSLLSLEEKTQMELSEFEELRHNKLIRFWIILAVIFIPTIILLIAFPPKA